MWADQAFGQFLVLKEPQAAQSVALLRECIRSYSSRLAEATGLAASVASSDRAVLIAGAGAT